MKPVEVCPAAGGDLGDELLRRLAGFLSGDHVGRAVRVLGADEVDRVPAHALEAHPDVGLDVLHDVTDVQRPVGVRQGGRDEDLAGHSVSSLEVRDCRARGAAGCQFDSLHIRAHPARYASGCKTCWAAGEIIGLDSINRIGAGGVLR
jgi:hypothetical protein